MIALHVRPLGAKLLIMRFAKPLELGEGNTARKAPRIQLNRRLQQIYIHAPVICVHFHLDGVGQCVVAAPRTRQIYDEIITSKTLSFVGGSLGVMPPPDVFFYTFTSAKPKRFSTGSAKRASDKFDRAVENYKPSSRN